MGFDQGAMTFRVCRLPQAMPKDAVARFMENRAASLESMGEDPQYGWTTARHLLDTNITEETVKIGGYYHLCLRKAEKKIPSSLLNAECRVQEFARMEADRKEYVNRKERKEIREEVRQRLLPSMPPQLSGIYVVIDIVENLLFTTAVSQRNWDVFSGMFNKTMGFAPIPLDPEIAAEEYHVDPGSVPFFCISPDRNPPEEEAQGTLGENFLTWLWYYLESCEGVYDQGPLGKFALMLDGPLTFVSASSGSLETVVRKGMPTISAEAKASLLVGKKLKSAKLQMSRDQNQDWTCQVDAETFAIRGLKIPEGEALDARSVFEERMTMLQMFYQVFYGLYQVFLSEMADSGKADAYRNKAKQWVANRESR